MTVFADLGDFTPAEMGFSFSIGGKRFRFEYPEMKVDDVLRFLAASSTESDYITKTRSVVTKFLRSVIVEGDADELERGLASMPYKNFRGGLSIDGLLAEIQTAIKKKEPGEVETTTN